MQAKRLISSILAGAIAVSSLSGCSGSSPKKETTDTVKWINTTYALLTSINEADPSIIGGYEKTASNTAFIRISLEDWWSVKDRETADETLEWLLTEGHRMTYIEEMIILENNGYFELEPDEAREVLAYLDFTPEQTESYIAAMDAYREYGDSAMDAWDYCRALQLLGWYYVADYYTEEETLDKSLEIAKKLQGEFESWDELLESYLIGYNYWNGDDPTDPLSDTSVRRDFLENLKKSSQNPYTIDWNTELKKTW